MSEQLGDEPDDLDEQEDPAEILTELLEEVVEGLGLECKVGVEVGEGPYCGATSKAGMSAS